VLVLVAGDGTAHAWSSDETAHGNGAIAVLLAAALLLYVRGVVVLWRKAGVGRGIRVGDVVRFGLGMATLAGALLSPIDLLAAHSFALHMLEHELLMVIAAPLFVVSRPLEAWTFALPPAVRRRVTAFIRTASLDRLWRAVTQPVAATGIHALALWIWHAPPLFAAALASEPLHVLQHACFFASALGFWWAMVGGAARRPVPVALACLFATMLHTSALGALLTLAPSAWYASGGAVDVLGLSALEDQQLGGLIMWVPGGLAYVIVALSIVAAWLAPPRMRRNTS
jgi:putative membrane protein